MSLRAQVEHLLGELYPDGCFVVGVSEGECDEPIFLARNSMQWRNLESVTRECVTNCFGPSPEELCFIEEEEWGEDWQDED